MALTTTISRYTSVLLLMSRVGQVRVLNMHGHVSARVVSTSQKLTFMQLCHAGWLYKSCFLAVVILVVSLQDQF